MVRHGLGGNLLELFELYFLWSGYGARYPLFAWCISRINTELIVHKATLRDLVSTFFLHISLDYRPLLAGYGRTRLFLRVKALL